MNTTTKERPILFSAEMVRAILDGRKTQTRRPLKSVPTLPHRIRYGHADGTIAAAFSDKQEIGDRAMLEVQWCPFGKPGDRLWVRETFATVNPLAGCERNCRPEYDGVRYRSTWTKSHHGKWIPSIHMPRWASRLTLEIESVRVERVNAISEADAEAEGFHREGCGGEGNTKTFARTWRAIYGDESWERDWCWALTFKVLE